MIVEKLMDVIFFFVEGILSWLPDMSWNIDIGQFSAFSSVIQTVTYLLPMQTVATIITIIIAISLFKTVISLIKAIWDILPVV